MKKIKYIATLGLLMASAGASALPVIVNYSFDTVTRFESGRDPGNTFYGIMSVTGVVQNATTPTTVSFTSSGATDSNGSRCIPVFLTMMEKPGRYVLLLTLDTDNPHDTLVSCGLELKS